MVDPRLPTDPVMPSYGRRDGTLAWLAAELWDHVWPWSREGLGRQRALQAAGFSVAFVASAVWVLAAMGRLQYGWVIAWWFGWSLYEVLVRYGAKRYVKDGPWWGRTYRVATLMDMVCYVAFKNLLIGAVFFITLKSLGRLQT